MDTNSNHIKKINDFKDKGNKEFNKEINKDKLNKRAITYFQLGIKYFNDEKHKMEINDQVNKLISILYSNLSLMYLKGDEIILSLEASNKSIEFNNQNYKAFYYQSLCKSYLSDYKGSMESIDKAITIYKQDEKIIQQRNRLIEMTNNKIKEDAYFDNVLKNKKLDNVAFENSIEKGRYLISKRLIKRGEEILRIAPFSITVHKKYRSKYCDVCFQKKSIDNLLKCKDCNDFSICKECNSLNEPFYKHHPKELCSLFLINGQFYKMNHLEFSIDKNNEDIADEIRLYIITIYNILKNKTNNKMVQKTHPENAISSSVVDVLNLTKKLLNSSTELQIAYSESAKKYTCIIEMIFQTLITHGANTLKKDEISDIIRIVDCNSHCYADMLNKSRKCSGLYPLASYANHSCLPNSNYYLDKNGVMVLYASSDIQESEAITISYIYFLNRLEKRRKELLKVHNFFCTCDLCNFQSSLTEEVCDKCNEIIPSTIGNSNLVYKEPKSLKETGFNYICPKGHTKSSIIFEIDKDKLLYPTIAEINSKCKDLRNFRKLNIFKEMLENRDFVKKLTPRELEITPLAKYVANPKKSNSMLIEELINLVRGSVECGLTKSIEESNYSTYLVYDYYDLYKSLLLEPKPQILKLNSIRDIIIKLLTPMVYNQNKQRIDKKLNKHLSNKINLKKK
ncbi:hypothetical protein ACTFIW_007730 [Dictyostelium discoideum]